MSAVELDSIDKPWACPDGVLAARADATRDEWLGMRRTLIGASDVAAILGVSNWGDATTVWADKTGLTPPEPATDAQRRGQVFEDAIVQLWSERAAGFPIRVRRSGLMRSRKLGCAGATVDRLSICGYEDTPSRCVVEVKSQVDMSEWLDGEVPVAYQLQGLWQLFVTGRDHVHYVVMGPRFRPEHRVILRNEPIIQELANQLSEWWDTHVVGGKAPRPTHRAAPLVRKLYRGLPGERVYADDAIAPLVHEALEAKGALSKAQERYDTAVATLQMEIGDATELRWPETDELIATWNVGKTIDGATADWRKANPELVEQFSTPSDKLELNTTKLVENHPELIETRQLRYRRTFNWK